MPPIRITRQLAFAASLDAGNRSMLAAHRTAWDEADAIVAAQAFNKLWPRCLHGINPEDLCYFCDQDDIPAGHPLSKRFGPRTKDQY